MKNNYNKKLYYIIILYFFPKKLRIRFLGIGDTYIWC